MSHLWGPCSVLQKYQDFWRRLREGNQGTKSREIHQGDSRRIIRKWCHRTRGNTSKKEVWAMFSTAENSTMTVSEGGPSDLLSRGLSVTLSRAILVDLLEQKQQIEIRRWKGVDREYSWLIYDQCLYIYLPNILWSTTFYMCHALHFLFSSM